MKRALIILGILFSGAVIVIGAGAFLFARQLTRVEAYPAFMEKDIAKGRGSYDGAKRAFSQFVKNAFPVGSDTKGAIAEITGGGFRVEKSDRPNSVDLVWNRYAGPCNERYAIRIDQTTDGKIADVAGQLYPTCL